MAIFLDTFGSAIILIIVSAIERVTKEMEMRIKEYVNQLMSDPEILLPDNCSCRRRDGNRHRRLK
jgi:hypothetical protein